MPRRLLRGLLQRVPQVRRLSVGEGMAAQVGGDAAAEIERLVEYLHALP